MKESGLKENCARTGKKQRDKRGRDERKLK